MAHYIGLNRYERDPEPGCCGGRADSVHFASRRATDQRRSAKFARHRQVAPPGLM